MTFKGTLLWRAWQRLLALLCQLLLLLRYPWTAKRPLRLNNRGNRHLMANAIEIYRIMSEIAQAGYEHYDVYEWRLGKRYLAFQQGTPLPRRQREQFSRLMHVDPADLKQAVLKELVRLGDLTEIRAHVLYPELYP